MSDQSQPQLLHKGRTTAQSPAMSDTGCASVRADLRKGSTSGQQQLGERSEKQPCRPQGQCSRRAGGAPKNHCPSALALLPGLEQGKTLLQDAVASVEPLSTASLPAHALPHAIQKVNPKSYLVSRWSKRSFPPLVTRWSRLSLKTHTEDMRNRGACMGWDGPCMRWGEGTQCQ